MIDREPQCIETIQSLFADDEMMMEIVALFVAELPDRIATLEMAFHGSDLELLHRTAHQLKGAFGSYGFDQLTEPTRKLEESTSRANVDHSEVQRDMEDLISFCRRIRA